jgi:lipopolysaccharide biosynthesis protein
MKSTIRPIAIYLPQFHPIPENDTWWGAGFTEWTNVVKAKPRFKGHDQPHLPSDLGFYDLRVAETRQAQADLAKEYGIYGFCYYHYWFNGRRVLERPFREVFESGKPDFPFMLCWANENWTRRWDRKDHQVLLKQDYSEDDDKQHINYLIPFFKDPRYIKVDGKPVFIIYKDALFPDIKETVKVFRDEARKVGMELYLCKFDRHRDTLKGDPKELGFDAAIEFQPFSPSLKKYVKRKPRKQGSKYLRLSKYLDFIRIKLSGKKPRKKDIVIDYNGFVDFDKSYPGPNYKLYPGVCPGWDNSSRRVNSHAQIFTGNTPSKFGDWVNAKIARFKPFSPEENFLFINAWNEWAEGNHLEPCQRWGLQFLEAFKKALNNTKAEP